MLVPDISVADTILEADTIESATIKPTLTISQGAIFLITLGNNGIENIIKITDHSSQFETSQVGLIKLKALNSLLVPKHKNNQNACCVSNPYL